MKLEEFKIQVLLSDEEKDQIAKVLSLADCQGKSFIDCPNHMRCAMCPFGRIRAICRTIEASDGRWSFPVDAE